MLEDMPGMENTVHRLAMLEPFMRKEQVLLGAFYYDEAGRRICVQPYSIVTNERVVRLLY